ncbi:Na+/H+ antiporter subunit G [Pseudalkalibacillus caeni]|uniref:Na+/H+ antiporter subunit G n=1 Tax=Exobacillus caeni TaxID=2574798 RepID=A0A5R9F6F1_9BACL|nr:monovalent cation/H(+) antiporter subunit G [Pseudalkalibacillus caeni]TLS39322.1 Na+/H+ antiporter subunit G [Pseudalkalibacillus caeni]
MKEVVISILLIIGTFFIFSGALGILRFPDVYTRIHAASKSSTLGVAGVLIAAFLFFIFEEQIISGKLLLGIIFILLTAPVGGHMISRAAYNSNVPLWKNTFKDEIEEHEAKGEKSPLNR